MQLFLGLVGFLASFKFLIIFYLPETLHPNKLGVDNLDPSLRPKWRPVILNPLQPIWLLRSPSLFIVVRILLSAISRTYFLFFYQDQTLASFAALLNNYGM